MSSIDMIREYTDGISEVEEELINRFLPGLMTIILKKNDKISSLICNGGEHVGIRIPDNEELIKIIDKLGRPVISTSANISDSDVITSVDMIEDELMDGIDYVEDGGEIVSESSSVVRVIDSDLVILREGKISDVIKDYFEKR
jgi:tRNA threonylcarbamoyl adenosine modification protein (Sua5/YciO/YrdC/YwlC family)